jgi:hypothetical protein
MKRIFIILGLLIFVLNSYGQQDGDFDNLDVNEELTVRDTNIIDLIKEHTDGTSVGAENGLTKTGSNIGLDGNLIRDTEIQGAGYVLDLGTTLSRIGNFVVHSTDSYIDASGELTLLVGGVEWVFDGTYFISDGGDTLMTNDLVDAKILANASYLPFNYNYNYSTTITDSRPGVGYFRLNNATYSNVTQIFIDNFDVNSTDKSDYLEQPDTGSYISISDGVNYVNFKLSGALTAASSYYKYAVTYLSHSGVLLGTCKISMDLSNNLGGSGADSLYHEYSSKWLANGDTIPIQDTSTYADTATYALNTPSDSLYHDDTDAWLLNGDTIPKSDSVRLEMTATNKLTTDSIYSKNDIVLYSGESLELNFGGNIYTYDGAYFYDDSDTLAKKSDIPSSDSSWVSFTTDTLKFGSNYMTNIPQNNILEWDVANNYYRPYSSRAASLLYTGTTNPLSSNRLNYDGYFHSTALYADGGLINVGTGMQLSSSIGITMLGSNMGEFLYEVATATNPIFVLNKNTKSTGIGGTNNYISLIDNGTEALRVEAELVTVSSATLSANNIIADEITGLNKSETDTLIMGADSATQILPAQTYIPLMDLDSLQVDKLVGSTDRDSIYVGGSLYISEDLYVYGKSFLNKYIAHAYISTDSIATTSLSTTWAFLGGGSNNKFINDVNNGFSFDDDTLVFNQFSSDTRDSIMFFLNYDGTSSTNTVNETVYNGIFIKHEGGSYVEISSATKTTQTSTADIYYPGPICSGAVLWLKDGDKIHIRAKVLSGTTTLSTTSFGVLLEEE